MKITNFIAPELKDIDTIEKALEETKRLFKVSQIDVHYSYPIRILLHWLVASTIGLAYHYYFTKRETDSDALEDGIFYHLDNYFKPYDDDPDGMLPNALAYDFQELIDEVQLSIENNKTIEDFDYVMVSLDYWSNFLRASKHFTSSLMPEFEVALTELISDNSLF